MHTLYHQSDALQGSLNLIGTKFAAIDKLSRNHTQLYWNLCFSTVVGPWHIVAAYPPSEMDMQAKQTDGESIA